MSSAQSAQRALFPSPLAGEGARAEAKPSEGGRGVVSLKNHFAKRTPLPVRARYRSALTTLSRKGRGEESSRLTLNFSFAA